VVSVVAYVLNSSGVSVLFGWFGALSLLATIPAGIATRKGRTFGFWWLLGLFAFLPALVVALLIQPTEAARDRDRAARGYRPCPWCAELIRPQARVCRYCGREMTVQAEQSR
jgi:hypothetical protein